MSSRFALALSGSLLLHVVLTAAVGNLPAVRQLRTQAEIRERVAYRYVSLMHVVVPTPVPLATPPNFWSKIDRSIVKKVRLTPADEQVVVLAARQGNGEPSLAPHIMRVEITPGIVHEHSVMHIRVFASPEANGVYVRFLVWEIGVPPVGAFHFPANDPDYANRAYEDFERDYTLPHIPSYAHGKTYSVEVIVTGRQGIASGAFIPIHVD